MIKKADSLQMGLRPLLAKTLENAYCLPSGMIWQF